MNGTSNEYKYLVASDLDGTLLAKADTISEENRGAIEKMAELGICFAPCSGRTFYEMPECIRNDPNIRYYIGSDGASVWEKKNGGIEKIINSSMDQKEAHRILDILDDYENLPTVRSDGHSYVNARQCCDDAFAYHRMGRLYGKFVKYYSEPKEDFSSFVRQLSEVEMMCIFFRTDAQMNDCKRRIEALGEYKVTSSEPTNMEIVSNRAGKGKGMTRLAECLHIPHSKTVAVGDSKNDLDMLNTAYLPLAMENASDEVKSVAKRTICHYKEHSAKYILENILEL